MQAKTTFFAAAMFAVLSIAIMPAAVAKYRGGSVKDGGTIEGTVTFKGAPAADKFDINKNPEVCGKGHKTSPRLVVGKGGGVKNAVVYLESIKKGKSFDGAAVTIDQEKCEYSPHVVIAEKKTEVTLKSSDAILHNIHMYGAATYNIPFPDKNTIKKKMRKSGVVEMVCDAGHGWMSAFIHVVEHPYYAVTDAKGKFSLEDVPAGKYTLKVWHEGWKIVEKIQKDGVVARYKFADPVVLTKDGVEVTAGAIAKVDFQLE